jgi:hypothetical protein
VLKLVAPGSDQYLTEKYAFEIESLLKRWSAALKKLPHDHAVLTELTVEGIQASPFSYVKET